MQGRHIDHVDVARKLKKKAVCENGTPLQGTPIVLNEGQEFQYQIHFKSR